MSDYSGLNLAFLNVDELRVLVDDLLSRVSAQQLQIEKLLVQNELLQAENAKLRSQLSGKGGPPPFVKANSPLQVRKKKEQEKKERKKRSQSFARKRDEPTRVVKHGLTECPDCGNALTGDSVHRRRQVIDIPEHPVEVVEHQIIARYCRCCRKRHLPSADLSSLVLGKQRFGVRLMSFIAYLRTECRLPVNTIQSLLLAQYRLTISEGGIVELLHRFAECGQQAKDQILADIRSSPFVHGDETGLREQGINGYLWGLFTPTACYYHRTGSRAGAVALELLGAVFRQVLVTDFYAGYNGLLCRHQRCWVHLLRDLHKLKEAHPDLPEIAGWVKEIYLLYKEAIDYQQRCREAQNQNTSAFGYNALQRRDRRRDFESKLGLLCAPFLDQKVPDADPRSVLAERMEKFAAELFVFIEFPEVPADNNAAERGLRPAVIARKISGGTRSPQGSQTACVLRTLFGTWKLREQDLLRNATQIIQLYNLNNQHITPLHQH